MTNDNQQPIGGNLTFSMSSDAACPSPLLEFQASPKFLTQHRNEMLDVARRPFATMVPRMTYEDSGICRGTYWSLKPSGNSPEVAHDDSIGV